MKHHTFYLTILLLIYNNEAFITNYKNKEYGYKFFNTITASNKASDKVLSQWTYSGVLIVQEYDDCKIFKLDNVRTTFFNGQRNNITVKESHLSNDKKILTEPFGVYVKSLTDVNISVKPNDELWSINMKKSIASSFLIDTSLDKGKTETEQLIFGKCDINLEIHNSRSTKIIEKTINHKSCVAGPIKQTSNVNWVNNTQRPFEHETKRVYVISKNNCLFSIESSSNFTLQSSPDVRSPHRIEQNQYYELITTKENTKPFKIHNNTIIKNLKYENEDPVTSQTNQNEFLQKFITAYTKFKTHVNEKPINFWDISTKTPISEMLNNLKKLDDNCLKKLLIGILMGRDQLYYEIFLEILPYAGTKPTINLIKEIIKDDDVDVPIKLKILTTFPEYVVEIDEETIKNFEEFFTFEYNNIHIKQIAVLSFTALISRGLEQNTISNEFLEKYVKKFYEPFINNQTHEDKMINLLALVNIANKVPINAILNIIYNQRESRHIRELAMYGFKNSLKTFGSGLFNKFWAITKNTNENFETRIAALDLILSLEMTEEEFNEMVDFYDRPLDNPFDEHLANYFITTIISLQNNTGYQDYLGEWATSTFQTRKLRQNLKTWSTGNYRFSFTDKNQNFGVAMQTKLVTNPKTNFINVIQFNLKHYALSMDLGEYTIYLKLEGLLDDLFVDMFLGERSYSSEQDILNLLQQCKYEVWRRNDLHIDAVVFRNGRAIWSQHFDRNGLIRSQDKIVQTIMKFIQHKRSIHYPILNHIRMPSDLGTELKIEYDMQQVAFREIHNLLRLVQDFKIDVPVTINNKIFTQMTETISSMNPLLDTSIYVEKLHHDFKKLDLPLSINQSDLSISWNNKNDIFNWVMENTIYTSVDNKTILKKHCETCNEFEEIPSGEAKAECIEAEKHLTTCRMDNSIWREKIININSLGVSFNLTSTKESEEMEKLDMKKQYGVHKLSEVLNSHQGNALTFPFASPFLYYLHYTLYSRYLDHDLMKLSVRSSALINEAYTTKIKLALDQKFMYDFDPITYPLNETVNLFISQTRNSDKNVLSGVKLIFRLKSIVEPNSNQRLVNTGTNFEIVADVVDNEDLLKKFCLKHTIKYPNRLLDILSLDLIKPTEAITTVSWDTVSSFDSDECTPYFVKITEVLSINNEYQKRIKNMKEYRRCKQESFGLQYAPPTNSCIIAHKAASIYRDYTVQLQRYNQEGRLIDHQQTILFEYHHIDDKTINVALNQAYAKALQLSPTAGLINYQAPSTFANFISTNPTEFITNSDRTCDISSHGVKSFFDKYTINNNHKDIIAFVQSNNSTKKVALTVKKIDPFLVFKFWSGHSTISTNMENNQIKLYTNGTEIKENIQNDELTIDFIANDVLYIRSDFVEFYYSPTWLSINIPSLYYKYLCGECLQ